MIVFLLPAGCITSSTYLRCPIKKYASSLPLISIIKSKIKDNNIFFYFQKIKERMIKMTKKDKTYEGKKDLYLDIDRMINEGMAGGTVADTEDLRQISYDSGIASQEEPPTITGEQEEE
jgi:hypothetical protein